MFTSDHLERLGIEVPMPIGRIAFSHAKFCNKPQLFRWQPGNIDVPKMED
jgi:hypothetical protein